MRLFLANWYIYLEEEAFNSFLGCDLSNMISNTISGVLQRLSIPFWDATYA